MATLNADSLLNDDSEFPAFEETTCASNPVIENDANFAVICSFFLQFGTSLGVTFNIDELKTMVEETETCEFVIVYRF